MKIIFLNTWYGTLRDDLRAYIEHHKDTTSVFCLQEVYGDDRLIYEELLAETFVSHSAGKQSALNKNWYGNVIYVRKDIPIIETGTLFTEDNVDLDVGLAVFVTLTVKGESVTVCNVHGVPYPGAKLDSPARLYQSNTIIDALKDRRSVVIGGDFNLLPQTKSVKMFSEHGYQDLIADFDIKTTRNKLSYDRYPDNIQYYADYAFVSPNIAIGDFTVPSRVISDHQPLELEIETESLDSAEHFTRTLEIQAA